MLKSNVRSYTEIREYLDNVPVIETHEHYTGFNEPSGTLLSHILGYFHSDMNTASFGKEREIHNAIFAENLSLDERFNIFDKIYVRCNKTAYARVFQIGMQECWGITEFNRNTFQKIEDNYSNNHQEVYYNLMKRFGIKAKIVDRFFKETKDFIEEKSNNFSEYCRFAFPLPELHNIHNSSDILRLENYIDHRVTCLDDYLECVENYLKKGIQFGIVCMKDQSAYRRSINYENPSRSEAEKVFNNIIYRRRDIFGDDEVRTLDDWLFQHFMVLARKYCLPVQIHTGHMAGFRNDIAKTNASYLIPLLELHQDVGFDLFHGNWPYMDEYIFICKNYPNAYLDLCWVQSIDPIYCIELIKRAVMTIPSSKIMAFGGDSNTIESVIGSLVLARDNVACALSELIDSGWIGMKDAKQMAADWFFNNPNEFFKLGFEPFNA